MPVQASASCNHSVGNEWHHYRTRSLHELTVSWLLRRTSHITTFKAEAICKELLQLACPGKLPAKEKFARPGRQAFKKTILSSKESSLTVIHFSCKAFYSVLTQGTSVQPIISAPIHIPYRCTERSLRSRGLSPSLSSSS